MRSIYIIFCVLFSCAFAQSAVERAAVKAPEISQVYRPYLKGKVVSTDSTLSLRSHISIEGTDIYVYSQNDGTFSFRGVYLESGVLRIGHNKLTKPIYVPFDTINRGPFII
ncbi:PIN domain-containing protein, partial [Sphingobacterium faecale]